MAVYMVYDPAERVYLETFKKPVKGVDAAVTRWTENREYAMRFKVLAAARSAVTWLGDGTLVIMDEEGKRL